MYYAVLSHNGECIAKHPSYLACSNRARQIVFGESSPAPGTVMPYFLTTCPHFIESFAEGIENDVSDA